MHSKKPNKNGGNPNVPWPDWFPFIFVNFVTLILAVFRSKERSRRLQIEQHIKDFSDSQSLESYVCGLDPKGGTEPFAALGIFAAMLCIVALIAAAKVPQPSAESNLTADVSAIPTATTASVSSTNGLPRPIAPNPRNISPGVEDIVKLSKAHISDEVILNYATRCAWSAKFNKNDLLYMKSEGVSDSVLTELLRLERTK